MWLTCHLDDVVFSDIYELHFVCVILLENIKIEIIEPTTKFKGKLSLLKYFRFFFKHLNILKLSAVYF